MMYYRNNSTSVKTFYGVTFQPGQVRSISTYIHDPDMVRVRAGSDTIVAPTTGTEGTTSNTSVSTTSAAVVKSTTGKSAAKSTTNSSNKEA